MSIESFKIEVWLQKRLLMKPDEQSTCDDDAFDRGDVTRIS